MGDPKKTRKKYSTPGHPWQRARIEEEAKLMQEYGFKNKREIWKMGSFLRDATAQAKKLVTLAGPQAEKEKSSLLSRLKKYGLLKPEAALDAVLSISLRDVLERRLQTVVYKKTLANTIKQARQFITHEQICVAGKVVTSPSYLVHLSEENQIGFRPNSKLSNPEHPERAAARKAKEKEAKETVVDKGERSEPKQEKREHKGQKEGKTEEKPKRPKKKKEEAKEGGQ
jgi:small subunit ribosomal protein S4